ncbi:protein mono-ADP-ribosyltransferase PARP9 isoform X2 [Notamacropus eugenii]
MELKSLQINIGSDNLKILKSCESLFNDVINKKFQCTSNLESATDSAKVFSKILSSQIELSVWKDDLTRHNVDAVVNAANESLCHIGGLALALLKAGGPIIEEESREQIKKSGKVPTGQIAVTSGGRLPCSQIIHAVGPQWRETDGQRCCSQLEEAIMNILYYLVCENSGIKTVAIPALSSGIFGFPLELCVEIIVSTIVTFPYSQSNILKEIHLVSNEESTVAAFKKSCEHFLCRNLSATPPLASITLNNVNLQLIEGSIEKQQVDVIVNSVSAKNSFDSGLISEAILVQAGPELEKEFIKKLTETSKSQQLVVVTTGFNLACKYVFHIVWPSCDNRKKTLKVAVKKCLEKSCHQPINSFSFPPLGTGNIGIQKEEAVRIMLTEVLQFSKDHPNKKLLVNFVVLPQDNELSKAFKSELANIATKMGPMAPKMNKESDKEFKVSQWSRKGQGEAEPEEAPPTSIHLKGNNEEQLAAAKKWIFQLLQAQECRFIENNHIFYLGKEEHDQLSHLSKVYEVSISEDISSGKATLEIRGKLNNIIPMMLRIENLLWSVQMDYAEKLYSKLVGRLSSNQPQDRNLFEKDFLKDKELQEKKLEFEKAGLEPQKVEVIYDPILSDAFNERKIFHSKRAHGNTHLMLYQEVPHQFCNLVRKVGFQRIYSMPSDPRYGYGIYFSKNLKKLADNLRKTSDSDSMIYVFEADVIIGSYCEGNPAYISPPPLGASTTDTYDSVVDNVKDPETFVIFDSTQALPLFLWTCALKKSGFFQMEANKKGSMSSSV